jgi:uncharacterized protein with FMN-binding domain
VIAATAAGLAGVLSFHTTSAPLTIGGLPVTSTAKGAPGTSVAAGAPPPHGSSGAGSPPTSTTPTTIPSNTSTSAPAITKSANGPLINYNYGVLSVSIKVKGKKIVDVGIASLDDGGNFRSQSIDQQSIPLLEQQALQAQSANIQGVSGASYTSAGFEQSLQAALSKLGVA